MCNTMCPPGYHRNGFAATEQYKILATIYQTYFSQLPKLWTCFMSRSWSINKWKGRERRARLVDYAFRKRGSAFSCSILIDFPTNMKESRSSRILKWFEIQNKPHSSYKDVKNDDFQVSALLKVRLEHIYLPTTILVNLRLWENQSSQILDA